MTAASLILVHPVPQARDVLVTLVRSLAAEVAAAWSRDNRYYGGVGRRGYFLGAWQVIVSTRPNLRPFRELYLETGGVP